MYRIISRLYPKKVKEHYANLLRYSHIKVKPEIFLGFFILFGFGTSLVLAFDLAFLFNFPLIITLIATFIILQLATYFWFLLKADATAKFIESILPDALQLMASNLRAGLTTDKALLLSARPEFGVLKDEIDYVGKEVATGKEVGESLMDMTKRIKSEKLEKTMLLVVSGLKSGGELTSLLDQTALNLRQQKFVEEKIKANVLMYVIFIFSAIGFGAPLLFGLSSFLIEVITKNLSVIRAPETLAMPITITAISISPGFIKTFAIISLITTSILGSLVLGMINKGKERAGIKFIPILMGITICVFFIVRLIIRNMFSGLFGI